MKYLFIDLPNKIYFCTLLMNRIKMPKIINISPNNRKIHLR